MNAQQPKTATGPNELGKPFNPGVQVTRLRYSPDGKTLAAACFDGKVRRWDMTGKEPVELPAIGGHNAWVTSIEFAGTTLLSADSWGRLTATDLDAKEPKRLWTVDAAHDGWLRGVAVAPDGSRLATCGKDGFVRLWACETGKIATELEVKSDVLSVCFATNGKTALAGDLFGIVREFALPGGKITRTFEAKELHRTDRVQDVGGARCLLLSGDGKTLFVAGGEPKTGGFVQAIPLLIAFDLASGKRVGQYRGAADNEGYVTDLAWHPAGFVAFTASGQPGQGKLHLWKPGDEKPLFTGGKLPNCHSVAIHPDEKTLAVSATNANSSGNGRVKGKDGEYPANTSPIQLWSLPKL